MYTQYNRHNRRTDFVTGSDITYEYLSYYEIKHAKSMNVSVLLQTPIRTIPWH